MLVQITLESAVGSGEGEGSWLIVAISFCAKELGGWGSHLCAEEGGTGRDRLAFRLPSWSGSCLCLAQPCLEP